VAADDFAAEAAGSGEGEVRLAAPEVVRWVALYI
jgi:hypothetical protein